MLRWISPLPCERELRRIDYAAGPFCRRPIVIESVRCDRCQRQLEQACYESSELQLHQ